MNITSDTENYELLNKLSKFNDFKTSFMMSQSIEKEENYVMYILINSSLKMGKGKIAAQVGHGVHKITQYCLKNEKELWIKYIKNKCPKIILKTKSQEELLNILNNTQNYFKSYVIDEGRTQIPKNSLTVICYKPILKENVPNDFKILKLL